jgi:hypothetical protein
MTDGKKLLSQSTLYNDEKFTLQLAQLQLKSVLFQGIPCSKLVSAELSGHKSLSRKPIISLDVLCKM